MQGTIDITLRPLKFAFLVHPHDRSGLRSVLELNTILWGGQFNPIIPTYRRLPPTWQRTGDRTSAGEVFSGYLEAYDTDYVVPVGRIQAPPFPVGNRTVVTMNEVYGEWEQTGSPRYGIGLFDLLRHFVHEELRFERRFPLTIVLPESPRRYSLFSGSVLGMLSKTTEAVLREKWTEPLGAVWKHCEGPDYADLMDLDTLFPRRLSSLFISVIDRGAWRRGNCVFVMDATRITDIMDFWNLRAAGRSVIPVPIQLSRYPSVQRMVRKFIDDNYFQYSTNDSIYNYTSILNSQHITKDQVDVFIRDLKIQNPKESNSVKFVHQTWYPRIWSSWARPHDNADPCHLEADTKTIDIPDGSKTLRLNTLDPDFIPRFSATGKPLFANMIDIRLYGAKGLVAEVIPEGDHNLARAVGGFGISEWRFARSGMTYLSSYNDWSIRLDVPDAESIFVEWFRQHGWDVMLSPAGRIAKQMFLSLEGIWGVDILTNEGIVKLFGKMSDGKSMRRKEFAGEVSKIANLSHFPTETERMVRRLVDYRAIRLGLTIQCPVCTQHSWYSLEDVAYRLQCMKCLERFDVPSHSPDDLAWSYRLFGPFSLPGHAHGSYSVLLTHSFFSRVLDGATTAIMSFHAKRQQKNIEADLGLFFSKGTFRRTPSSLLFAECKSYGRFELRDIERMTTLGAEFPGAILVFATFRKALSEREKRMLRKVAKRGRKYSVLDPNHNPVLVLTGIELFANFRPPKSWEDAGGRFAEFARTHREYPEILGLCDCTQQLHLDMESYHDWLEKEFVLTSSRAARRP